MTIGGFNGSDPAPTLSEFQAMVAAGKVRYVLLGGRGPGRDQVIEQWVLQHGRLVTGSLYDLSGGSRNE